MRAGCSASIETWHDRCVGVLDKLDHIVATVWKLLHDTGRPGGWWILIDVDVQITTHDVVRHDVCGWRRERLADPWDMQPIAIVPDWVCEILSPSNAATDRVKKRRLYASGGVAFCCLVDPATRTLEALELRDGVWVELGSYGDGDVARIDPFAEVALDIARLFPPPR